MKLVFVKEKEDSARRVLPVSGVTFGKAIPSPWSSKAVYTKFVTGSQAQKFFPVSFTLILFVSLFYDPRSHFVLLQGLFGVYDDKLWGFLAVPVVALEAEGQIEAVGGGKVLVVAVGGVPPQGRPAVGAEVQKQLQVALLLLAHYVYLQDGHGLSHEYERRVAFAVRLETFHQRGQTRSKVLVG